jgi:hypothetical protein
MKKLLTLLATSALISLDLPGFAAQSAQAGVAAQSATATQTAPTPKPAVNARVYRVTNVRANAQPLCGGPVQASILTDNPSALPGQGGPASGATPGQASRVTNVGTHGGGTGGGSACGQISALPGQGGPASGAIPVQPSVRKRPNKVRRPQGSK